MTVYAVIKIFDTLAEADRFAEQVTEDDVVAVFPLDSPLDEGSADPLLTAVPADSSSSGFPPLGVAAAPATRDALSDAAATPSGPEDLGKGLPASLTAGESNRPARVFYLDEHPRTSRWERRHWGYSVKV